MSARAVGRPVRVALLTGVVAAACVLPAVGGGALNVDGAGTPMKWSTAAPIIYNRDPGPLGILTNSQADALLADAFGRWQGVVLSDIAFTPGADLPQDINATGIPFTNTAHWANFWRKPGDGRSPVIYDVDGSIIDDMFGQGARFDILGAAGLDNPITLSGTITEASIVINGAFYDGAEEPSSPLDLPSQLAFEAAMVHEIGHFVNLDHSVVNHELAGDGDADNDVYLPSMYPFTVDDEEAMVTLNPDDEASLAMVYPSAGWAAATSGVAGVIRSGVVPFQGAGVVARRTDNPLLYAYSGISGASFFPCNVGGLCYPCSSGTTCTTGNPDAQGRYNILGVAPGSYTICLDQIDTRLSLANGTFIGPLATPATIPGPEECYSTGESANPSTDDPDDVLPVLLTAGTGVAGNDILLNDLPLSDPFEPNDSLGTASVLADLPGGADTVGAVLAPGDLDYFLIPVTEGDTIRIDIDAAELGSSLDAVIGFYDQNNNPVVIVDDGIDPDSGSYTVDPALTYQTWFTGTAKVVVSSYPDTDLNGIGGLTSGPYWLRVIRDSDTDGDGTPNRLDGCPTDVTNDVDADGVCGSLDNCDAVPNPSQTDQDTDGAGDACDNCNGPGAVANFTFESGAAGWAHQAFGATDSWHLAAATCYGSTFGTSTAFVSNGNLGLSCLLDSARERSKLLSPPIALPASGSLWLSFDALSLDEAGGCLTGGGIDVKDVGITTNGGASWTTLNLCTALADGSGTWSHRQFPIVGFAGQTVQVIFVYDTADNVGGDTFAVDNVRIGPLSDNYNPGQTDTDGDGIGDLCDACTGDLLNDADGDGHCGNLDICPTLYNPGQDELLRIKLNTPLAALRDLTTSSLSPDGARVVYRADQDTDNVFELYSVPVGGGTVTKLNPSFPAGRNVGSFLITPDSQRVVYIADQNTDEVQELYSVQIGGGVSTKLNDALPALGDVFASFLISPNSARVIYRADRDIDNTFELFSVPAGGGAVTKLNTPFVAGRSIGGFSISPNSARVIYYANQDISTANELYSVPMGGGPVTKLNPALVAGRTVLGFFPISPDSSRVVYIADQVTDDVFELYSVSISGGSVTKLNAALPALGDVTGPVSISPDSATVIFRADGDTNDVVELYSAQIGGGPVTKLNAALIGPGDVSNFSISPDSSRVIYRADQETDDVFELHSVSIDGGAVTKLNAALVPGGDVSDYSISPDSSSVIYRADQDTDEVFDLYSVSIGGGAVPRLSAALAFASNVSSYLINPNSENVALLSQVGELYSVPLGGGAATRINAALAIGRSVKSFSITPDGLRVVYRADQDTGSVNELYSAVLADADDDGILSSCDLCPADSDPGQEDGDMDGLGDACDNCRYVSNPGQQDTETAAGPDLICDTSDDRSSLYGPDLACGTIDDIVGDGVGDVCVVWVDATPTLLKGGPEYSAGVSWGDYDGDQDPDLYVTNNFAASRLYRNDGGGLFTDVTAGPLLNGGNATSSSWGDYDRDGDLDLYLSNIGAPNQLLRNEGSGVFNDVTAGPLGMSGGFAASWVDDDRDADLDLYVSTTVTHKLLRNTLGVFTDVTLPPIDGHPGTTPVAAWGDYNNDGRQDVYLVIPGSGSSQLLRNEGGGSFTDVTTPELAPSGSIFGAAWGDYDNDGDLDLYLVRIAGASKLLRNDGSGNFTDVAIGPLGGASALGATAWGDYDNDGNLDLALAKSCNRVQWLRNLGAGIFVDASTGALDGGCAGDVVGLASADYDGDGDLDLFMTSDSGPNRLIRNDSPPVNHWLDVDLAGIGIGARILTVADGVTRIREVASQTGYLSQSSSTVHFGLGSSTVVEYLEIRWSDGTLRTMTDVKVDKRLTLPKPPPFVFALPPSVSILPADGAIDVALNTSIVLTIDGFWFSANATPDRITVSRNGIKVLGRIFVSADFSQITFDPVGRLQPNSRYDVSVQDLLGGPTIQLTSSFETVGDASSGTLEASQVGTQEAGAIIPGTNTDDSTGFSVAAVGDVNGDGIADIAVGAPNADVGGNADAGKVILVLGGTQLQSNTGTPLRIEYLGEAAGNQTGFAVSAAGDINNDGIADFLIGAPGASTNAGRVYVVYGNAGLDELAPATLNLSQLVTCGSPTLCGIIFTGQATNNRTGAAISAAGDINNDGKDDLLIGAPNVTSFTSPPSLRPQAGKIYLVYGPLTTPGTVPLSSVGGTVAGLFFNGEVAGDNAGTSVSSWPDVNGDMIDDLLIGAPGGDVRDEFGTIISNAGFVYAIQGGTANLVPNGPAGSIELNRVANGLSNQVAGVVFLGEDPNGQIGRSVTGETDIDGDGIADVIFGGNEVAWVIPGDDPKTETGTSQTKQQSTLTPAGLHNANGQDVQTKYKAWFYTTGLDGNLSGVSVGTAGDVNADGVDDLIIGAGGVDLPGKTNAGKAYISYGTLFRPSGGLLLSDIGKGSPGVAVEGFEADDDFGRSVGGGLDVNGDGIDDALVGAPLADSLASTPPNAGEAYVISPLAAGEVPLLQLTQTGSITNLEWSATHRALFYNVYRGTMSSVVASHGVFTSGATKLACGINTDADSDSLPDTTDTAPPAAGVIFYYLVTGRNLTGEGPLGPLGAVPPQINDSQCP